MTNPDDTLKPRTGAALVNKILKRGILTYILQELVTERNESKKDLKEVSDLFLKSILSGR